MKKKKPKPNYDVKFRTEVNILKYHAECYNSLLEYYCTLKTMHFDPEGNLIIPVMNTNENMILINPLHPRPAISNLEERIEWWRELIIEDSKEVEKLRKFKEDSQDETHD